MHFTDQSEKRWESFTKKTCPPPVQFDARPDTSFCHLLLCSRILLRGSKWETFPFSERAIFPAKKAWGEKKIWRCHKCSEDRDINSGLDRITQSTEQKHEGGMFGKEANTFMFPFFLDFQQAENIFPQWHIFLNVSVWHPSWILYNIHSIRRSP